MKQEVKIGQTDYTVLILIRDTAGAAKTGLTNASAGIDVCYTRVETDNDVVLTAGAPVALATPALTDDHLDWGFLEVDATNAPGLYRLDIADGVFASGAWSAVVSLIATGIDPCQIEFVLVAFDPRDSVRLGLTALPNAAADAAGGLPISDAGGLDIDTKLANTNEVTAARMGTLTDLIDGGRLDLLIDAIKACTDLVTAARMGVLTDWINGGRLDLILDIIAADTTTDIPALTALIQTAVDNNALAIAAVSGTIGTNGDGLADIPKTGFKLASDGMDLVACDVAVVGAAPTLLINKIQAIWNRLFTKKTVTATLETAYEKDDTTTMETWNLADDDTTASRTR